MKPFSPLYFVIKNRSRCILLMFMIFLSFGAYLGGLYIYTPQENWEHSYPVYDDMVQVSRDYQNDKKSKNYDAFLKEIKKHKDVHVIEMGWYAQLDRKTVMGFTDGTMSFSFRSVDDFKIYCGHFDIECDFSKLNPHTMVMSKLMADNRGIRVGDVLSDNDDNSLPYDVTVAYITEEDGYTQYFIGDKDEDGNNIMLLGNGIPAEQVRKYADEINKEHPISYPQTIREEVAETYSVFNTIFLIVIFFLALILAVTVNAAFVGMYQRREFEFAVYRGIGISKKRIIGKIAGEILLMDAAVLVIGSVIFFLGIYLLNELVLRSSGVYLAYYAPVAVMGLVICNITTIVPLIFTRSRALMKADVTEY